MPDTLDRRVQQLSRAARMLATIAASVKLRSSTTVDPAIREVDLHRLDTASAARLCDRIAATGALETVRGRALEMVAAGKRQLESTGFEPEQRKLLALVADGLVQRYS